MIRMMIISIILFCPFSLWAQSWGTGMWGGMQACSYPTKVGNGAINEDDTTRELQAALQEQQKQLKELKSAGKKLQRSADRAKSDISKAISTDYADFIFEHTENSRHCREYQGMQNSAGPGGPDADLGFSVQGQEGNVSMPIENLIPIQSFTLAEWRQVCDSTKNGTVKSTVCTSPTFQEREGGRGDPQACKKALTEYRKNYSQLMKNQREIERLEDNIARTKEEIKDAKQDALEARREGLASSQEGNICIECMQQGNGYTYSKPQTDWSSAIGNVALGLGSLYMGYQTNKTIANSNAEIGWPTDPYATVGYGYGLGATATGISQMLGGGSGIYGSIGGGIGQGSFGCAGNNGGTMGMMGMYGGMNGTGMWGNPYGMTGMGQMGGGIFNSGMGPWGMAGYGGMGNMMGGYGMTGMMGNMMGGYGMTGMMGNMMGGYGMTGMMGNMMGGYGMTGMMGSMMGGYGMTGMMGNMMGGYGMTGMMGNMMGGYGMTGMMGSMMGYDASSMQYQQQMIQLQLQQQQQYYQQYQQKSQVLSSLQQEMYSLMYKMQQIQYGNYSTGYLGGSTTSGYYLPSSYSTSTTAPGIAVPSGR